MGYPDVDSLYTAIGEGQVSTQNVITHILKFVDDDADESPEQNIVPLRRRSGSGPRRTKSVGVSVKGVDDVWVKLAMLYPVPGDQIVGFVTRGAGVSVHREDCVNVASLKKNQPERPCRCELDECSRCVLSKNPSRSFGSRTSALGYCACAF